MKAPSLNVKRLYSMLKFADGQTDGQTDRVITIGHPPGGGALINGNAFGNENHGYLLQEVFI